jgi:hypothetical protein
MGNTTEKTDTLPGEAGSELAGLGEEVREALNTIDFVTPSEVVTVCAIRALRTVRAELLRLARENALAKEKCRGLYDRMENLERAEAELDALRKRIAEAPTGTLRMDGIWNLDRRIPSKLNGKRVALLPVGGE